jgi:putative ABC transport system substrate-binding protein
MRRRNFLSVLGGAAAWPLAARAQQASVPVIGFMHTGLPGSYAHIVSEFRQGLKQSGYVEGQNVAIEYRWAENQHERLPELAADLVRRGRIGLIRRRPFGARGQGSHIDNTDCPHLRR